jgi:hypothetical protein
MTRRAVSASPYVAILERFTGAKRMIEQTIARGRVLQVDPIKPTLKAHGIILSKLRCDGPVSNFDFNFNLRRYTGEPSSEPSASSGGTRWLPSPCSPCAPQWSCY